MLSLKPRNRFTSTLAMAARWVASGHMPQVETAGAARRLTRQDEIGLPVGFLIGMDVYDTSGEYLAEVEQIVLDAYSRRVAFIVIALGGFLGMGRQRFAIPWRAVQMDRGNCSCVVDVNLQECKITSGLNRVAGMRQ